MRITIRPSVATDTETLVEIWRLSVRHTHDFLAKEDFEEIHRKLGTVYLPSVRVSVACADDRPVGFIGMSGRHVEMLFVAPSFMGRGLGRALLEHVEGAGPLTVDVNEQNTKAVEFYLHYGFVRRGRSEMDGDGRPYPLLHLARFT